MTQKTATLSAFQPQALRNRGLFTFVFGGWLASLHAGFALNSKLQPGCFPQLNSVEACVQFAVPAQPAKGGCQLQPTEVLHCDGSVTLGQ